MPAVSVVIPVYNVEKYLGACLDSVLRQTLTDIEIICVDDGSTDGSPALLAAYAARDPRLRVLTQPNAGAGAARNAGLAAAAGDYLFFCDPDDWCERGMLRALHRMATTHTCDIVVSGMIRHDGAAHVPAHAYPPRRLVARTPPFAGLDVADNLFTTARANLYNKLFRRSFIMNAGLRFQNLRRINDLFFSYAALAEAKRIAVLDAAMYHYRMGRPGSLQTAGGRDGQPLCWIEAFRAVNERLLRNGIHEVFAIGLLRSLLGTGLRDMMKLSRADDAEILYAAIREETLALASLCGERTTVLNATERALLNLITQTESALGVALFLVKHSNSPARAARAFLTIQRLAHRYRHFWQRLLKTV